MAGADTSFVPLLDPAPRQMFPMHWGGAWQAGATGRLRAVLRPGTGAEG